MIAAGRPGNERPVGRRRAAPRRPLVVVADLMDYLARKRTARAAFVVRKLLKRAEAAPKPGSSR